MDSTLRDKLDQAHQRRLDGDYDSARRLYEDVMAGDPQPPESAEVRWGHGLVLQFTGAFDESLSELERAHDEDPANVEYLLCLAKTRLMLGDFDRAVEELQEVEQKYPGSPAAAEAAKQLSYFR